MLNFEKVPNGEQNIKKLRSDRVIEFSEDRQGVEYRKKNDKDYAGIAIHPFKLNSRTTYFGVSKKGVDTQTLNKLFMAYEKLTIDGTFDGIKKMGVLI